MRKFAISRLVSLSFVALSLVVLPVTFISAASAADLKVLIVNNAAIMQQSLAARDQAAKLQAIFAAMDAEARSEMEPLAKESQDLQGQKALLGDAYATKQSELQRKAEFVKFKFEQERKYTQEAAQQAIIQKIFPIYNALMQEQKGTLLLDQSQVIMTSPDYNITEEVIKRLDASSPTVEVKRVTFVEIQKAFEEQQARIKAAQDAKK